LGAVLVEVSVVDTHPPLVRVLLADEDGVVTPQVFIKDKYLILVGLIKIN
jgi:hypothetical protein